MLHVNKRRVLVSVLGVGAIAMTVVAFATASSETRRSPATAGAVPTSAELTTVQSAVQQWLASAGFKGSRVAEVMAFTNNDYVAVDGRNGKPAFELIIAPTSAG